MLIASRNRCQLLQRGLESLAAQTQDPRGFEVIVADNASTDGTAEMVEAFDAPYALRLLRLDQDRKAPAVNAALAIATGAVCLLLDDDVIASPQLVEEHLATHADCPKTLGIGRLVQPRHPGRDPFVHAAAEAWNERYERLESGTADWADCYGANFSAPRAVLAQVGGLATDLPAVLDLEVAFRLSRAGCVPRYLPRAAAVHEHHKSGAKVLADIRRYGIVCVELAARHPQMRGRLLGWFTESTVREVALRRLLLALRVPPPALAAGRLVPGTGRRRVWFGFVSRYAFWRGVRSGMDRAKWLQTTRGAPQRAGWR